MSVIGKPDAPTDCRSQADETVMLIEAAIVTLRLASRQYASPDVIEAVRDLLGDCEIVDLFAKAEPRSKWPETVRQPRISGLNAKSYQPAP